MSVDRDAITYKKPNPEPFPQATPASESISTPEPPTNADMASYFPLPESTNGFL